MLGMFPVGSSAVASEAPAGAIYPTSADVSGSAEVSAEAVVFGLVSADVSGSAEAFAEGIPSTPIYADVSGSADASGGLFAYFAVSADVAGSTDTDADLAVVYGISATVSGQGVAQGDLIFIYPLMLNTDVSGEAEIIADTDIAPYGPVIIRTPRPPVGLNVGARATSSALGWTTVAQAFEYGIPPLFPDVPDAIRSNRFLITSAIASTSETPNAIVELRIVDGQNDPFGLRTKMLAGSIEVGGFTILPLSGMTLSGQEILQARSTANVEVSLGVVANTREAYDVVQ